MVIAGTALVLRNLLAAEHAFAEAVTLDPQLTRAWCNRPATPPYLTTYGYREGRRKVLRIHGPRCVDAVKPRTVMSSVMRRRNGLMDLSIIILYLMRTTASTLRHCNLSKCGCCCGTA